MKPITPRMEAMRHKNIEYLKCEEVPCPNHSTTPDTDYDTCIRCGGYGTIAIPKTTNAS